MDGGREGEDDVVGDGDEGENGKERLRTLKSVGGARAKTRTGCYLPFLTLSQRAVAYMNYDIIPHYVSHTIGFTPVPRQLAHPQMNAIRVLPCQLATFTPRIAGATAAEGST